MIKHIPLSASRNPCKSGKSLPYLCHALHLSHHCTFPGTRFIIPRPSRSTSINDSDSTAHATNPFRHHLDVCIDFIHLYLGCDPSKYPSSRRRPDTVTLEANQVDALDVARARINSNMGVPTMVGGQILWKAVQRCAWSMSF